MDFAYLKSVQERLDAIRTLTRQARIPAADKFRYSITDIQPGGFLRFGGDVCFVMQGGRYDEWDEEYVKKQAYSAHEYRLLNMRTGHITLLEWDEEDQVVSACASERKLKWSQLSDEAGVEIDEDDLEKMGSGDGIQYNGKVFWYDDDWAAKYIPAGKRKGEKAWVYEFEAEDGDMLTIEEWSGGAKADDYEIWYCRPIDPNAVEIISTSAAS